MAWNGIDHGFAGLGPAQDSNREQFAPIGLTGVPRLPVLTCPWCGGERKLVALINDAAVVRRILQHLGLPTAAPFLAPARSPPESQVTTRLFA